MSRGDIKKGAIGPAPLSENISIADLKRHYSGRKKRIYSEIRRTAEYLLEATLASTFDPDKKDKRKGIAQVQGVLESITDKDPNYRDTSFRDAYLAAMMLKSQIPVLKERRDHFGSLSLDAMGQAHENIVNILSNKVNRRRSDRLKFPIHNSLRAEIEIAGLASRFGLEDLFPFFPVAMEECNSFESQYNHDFYVITGDGKKLPVQIKSSARYGAKKYDPSVLVFYRCELSKVSKCIDVNHGGISYLLEKESKERLTYRERATLNSMSCYVLDRMQEHQETNLR